MTIKTLSESVERLPDRKTDEAQARQAEFEQLLAQAGAILDDGAADGVMFFVIPANTAEGEISNVAEFRCFGGEKLLQDLGRAIHGIVSNPDLGKHIQEGISSEVKKRLGKSLLVGGAYASN